MAAMHADEPAPVEPRFDVADRQRAEQLGGAVEHVGVVRIGVDRDDVVDRDELGDAVALDRQVAALWSGRLSLTRG